MAREFKRGDKQDLHAETPPLDTSKAIISIAANHKQTFSIMRIDVSRAYFHAKAQKLVRMPAEDKMGVDLSKKAMYGTRDAANNWERDEQEHLESWRYQVGTQLEQFVSSRRAASFTNDAW